VKVTPGMAMWHGSFLEPSAEEERRTRHNERSNSADARSFMVVPAFLDLAGGPDSAPKRNRGGVREVGEELRKFVAGLGDFLGMKCCHDPSTAVGITEKAREETARAGARAKSC